MAVRPQHPQIIQRHILKELRKTTPGVRLFMLKNNDLLELHFSVSGPKDTVYEDGIYHGRILLDMAHPTKPPNIQMITPSGRFEVDRNICFSYTSFHPESWSPIITFTDIIVGFMSLFTDQSEAGIGIIKKVDEAAAKQYAADSRSFTCSACGADHTTIQLE
ncbi:Ubiquitin-conjugating enzyme E2-28.4 kDa [Giardia duodenalis assemblage B]|uniref:Ubiquitin-conjugating enzyme E2-28.4 kDa n=3 Tax=Giardia intestinalis TaxID=5741 RepID=A0A132NYR8_GIAIN|nr:Ubiquitin-conjugating enzyme E2-28.4 kDa [Giardia intestinalis ATCC 50581]ESU44949.1 Ubiquitin-conjugating enzyme E2 [Giardia intestinalis]KWX15214.1 Ubiquitin-conjugating enzyme E2-28.4 kDa [Giardia intestinalis assemblage B]